MRSPWLSAPIVWGPRQGRNQVKDDNMALRRTKVELNNAVFSLPDIVAKEQAFLAG